MAFRIVGEETGPEHVAFRCRLIVTRHNLMVAPPVERAFESVLGTEGNKFWMVTDLAVVFALEK